MTYEEYKLAVDKKCKEMPIAKQHPQEYKRAFDTEIEEFLLMGSRLILQHGLSI